MPNILYTKPLKLNLGGQEPHEGITGSNDAYDFDLAGYTSVGLTHCTHCNIDIRKLPFGDNEAIAIRASHCLEHIPPIDVPKALQEWYRVAAPGCLLRVYVPDVRKLCQRYLDHKISINKFLELLSGKGRDPYDIHLTAMDKDFLSNAIKRAGFSIIEYKKRPGATGDGEWLDLGIYAIKPGGIWV